MKEIYPLIRDVYYKRSDTPFYKRQACRAFLFKDNKFCLLHIVGEDKFGKRDHYETPGGGVENGEDNITTLKREILEETGYTIKNIQEIGYISIEYALLNRIDVENYYYCECDTLNERHLLDYEKELKFDQTWFSVDEALEMYKTKKCVKCGQMIHEREYNALLYLKKLFESDSIKK